MAGDAKKLQPIIIKKVKKVAGHAHHGGAWKVAYADRELDAHEHHVISKVAGLLHVTHGQYIGAKMRAKVAANI